MPKIIDYGGRFAFFELAAFTLVRDQGVEALSRHGVARALGTSISTVRRLLSPEADLRSLALSEVGARRRVRLTRPSRDLDGVDAGLARLRAVVPTQPDQVAEELVWWRLAVAAPTTASIPGDHEHEDGPLSHRFSIATHGYVTGEALEAGVVPRRATCGPDGEPDPVIRERDERHAEVRARVEEALHAVAPGHPEDSAAASASLLHSLVDGLGVQVSLGLLDPAEAGRLLRAYLVTVAD